MTEQFAIDVAQNAFMIALQIGGPLLAGSLAVGMLVSVFQAVTQINEQSLSFVPKILVVAGALACSGRGWRPDARSPTWSAPFNALPPLAH